eukprot:sb/3469163/
MSQNILPVRRTNQNSLFRSRDWLSANQGSVFPDSVPVENWAYPAASNFVDGKVFQAKIVVEEEFYRTLERSIRGGVALIWVDGLQWSSDIIVTSRLHPRGSVESGIVDLNQELEVGDEIVAYGVYADGTSKFRYPPQTQAGPATTEFNPEIFFSVNIYTADDITLIHADFRPDLGEVVLNSFNSANGGWETELSKQPIRTRYLGHVTSYQPIRDQCFLIRYFSPGEIQQLGRVRGQI